MNKYAIFAFALGGLNLMLGVINLYHGTIPAISLLSLAAFIVSVIQGASYLD